MHPRSLRRFALVCALLAAHTYSPTASFLAAEEEAGQSPRPAALLLSNWQYEYLFPLVTPEFDLARMRAALEAQDPPYEVTELPNATTSQMREAVEAFAKRHENNPVALIHYSGHGVEVFGSSFLAGIDVNPETLEPFVEEIRETYLASFDREARMERLARDFAAQALLGVDELVERFGTVNETPQGKDPIRLLLIDADRIAFRLDEHAGGVRLVKRTQNPSSDETENTEAESTGRAAAGADPQPPSESSSPSAGSAAEVRASEKTVSPKAVRPSIFIGMSTASGQPSLQAPGKVALAPDKAAEVVAAGGVAEYLRRHYADGGSASEFVNEAPSLFTGMLADELEKGGQLEAVFRRTARSVYEESQNLVESGLASRPQTPASYSVPHGRHVFRTTADALEDAGALSEEEMLKEALTEAKADLARARAELKELRRRSKAAGDEPGSSGSSGR